LESDSETHPPHHAALIAVVCLGPFVVGLLFAVPPFLQQLTVLRKWPAADARVIHSQVVPLHTDSGQMLYDTLLVLSYQVGGRPYVSSVGSLHQSTSYKRKKKQADRFAPGSHTEVRYNPSDPRDRSHTGRLQRALLRGADLHQWCGGDLRFVGAIVFPAGPAEA